ncbi:glycosyltransferase family 9 protein [Symbioplanes lichenis]|uniref:glycosyltransferase family 9 protein n=1 Tax=Symbioplanes lichenis TaxID=1629072 RepID=UPI002739CF20|nr:glycosyltransferase family 9 protein [Actinoplanes lichenis]
MILVLRALGVGDLAAGVPAIRAVRSHFADRTLALAAPAWLTPLIDLIGGVDRVVPQSGLVPLPPLPPVEIAINLHGSGPQSTELLASARPEQLWAFGAGPSWRDEEHERDRWCRMLAHYGVAASPDDTDLAVPRVAVPHGVTIIHPGAKSPSRRWPVSRYATVARALASSGHKVVVTGSAAERDIASAVAAAAGLGESAVLDTGLAELAGLVAHARLLISGDTGIAHLATAYRTPSVTLFGPMPPARWGPPPDRPQHQVIWHGTRAERGDAPGPDVHPALLAITPSEVLERIPHA